MNPPYIPATALGGDLVRDWSGPCEVLAHARFPVPLPDAAHLAMLRGESAWVACFLSLDACGGCALPERNVCLDRGQNFSFDPARCRMRLDLRRPEVAHRVADVLRACGHEVGPFLPVALGGRVGDATAYVEDSESGMGVAPRTIPAADVSAVLLAASAAGVKAGVGVVRGIAPAWAEPYPLESGWWERSAPGARLLAGVNNSGWWVPAGDPSEWPSGPETGPEGRAAADAALLRLGFAYLDSAAPFGVVAPMYR